MELAAGESSVSRQLYKTEEIPPSNGFGAPKLIQSQYLGFTTHKEK